MLRTIKKTGYHESKRPWEPRLDAGWSCTQINPSTWPHFSDELTEAKAPAVIWIHVQSVFISIHIRDGGSSSLPYVVTPALVMELLLANQWT